MSAALPGANPQSGLSHRRSASTWRRAWLDPVRDGLRRCRSARRGSRRSRARSAGRRAEPAEHREVARDGNGELEHVLPDLEAAQDGRIGVVAALADPALPRLVPPAEVHRGPDAVHARHDLVEQVHAERGLRVGIGEARAHLRVDEQAQVRIVELGHRDARRLDREELAAKHRHQRAHEGLAGRVRRARSLRIPHALGRAGRARAAPPWWPAACGRTRKRASSPSRPGRRGVMGSTTVCQESPSRVSRAKPCMISAMTPM